MDYNRIIIFGDSLQDTGNLFKYTNFPSNPFFNGRFSNGYVVSEYFYNEVKSLQNNTIDGGFLNYAIGGALVSNNNPIAVLKNYSLSINDQFNCFLNQHGRFKKNDLILINGGSNNFLFTLVNQKPFINMTLSSKVAYDLYIILEKLIINGANNIIFWNLPDVTSTPLYNNALLLPYIILKFIKIYLQKQIIKQNQYLLSYYNILRQKYKNINIKLIDIYTFFNDVYLNPDIYEFYNIEEACISSLGGIDPLTNVVQQNIIVKNDPNKFLFWDYVHPTTKAHKIFSNYIIKNWYNMK